MADNRLDTLGLQYFYNRLKTIFAFKSEAATVERETSSITIDGAGAKLEIENTANGLAFISEAHDGSGTSIFEKELASKSYVDSNGGKIDEIQVNGVTQTIEDKTVNLDVPTVSSSGMGLSRVRNGANTEGLQFAYNAGTQNVLVEATNNSSRVYQTELVSKNYVDATFQTEAQVQELIDSELADITGIDFQVVATLPTTGVKGVIYLVPEGSVLEPPYDEYIWIEPEGGTAHWEKIGDTRIDLSGYWAKTELVAITTAEIDAIIEGA